MKNNKVLVVVGPTAVGKTALGIDLAIKMNGEIISGDSQQVYQGLDIGTAKVTKAEQALAVHHLIDVRKWTENFSVHDFVMEAHRLIKEIIERGNVPIIVGGTGLYIQSLIEGYHLGGQKNHQAMMELRETLSALTDEELFEKVLKLNPNFPELNRRRAIRFLELQTFGSTDENSGSDYNFLLIGLNAERKVLYERINQRVEQMMSEGLLAEARTLFEKAPDAQAAKGIGYKEFFPYFSGEISLEDAVELVKRNSRRYAKRQLTWFRNRMEVEFEDVFSETYPDSVFEKVTQFLN
ncbi:MAG: tRNA (adenosine(37)-N6)-dimethylallyltransferase MiaA [Lactococcus lactis]|uniref:tRNA dimethylallyltransferase n=2 Tax=Lactococcus lactis subsp. cremoris TaxID=1359 RepID=T0VDT8_LACLC|nr:tRNA (adenosine(37)-N6)-dimethylallyltransferase MiaA [Lactococcus cremoris]EQC94101.1 tRNA delta(2)-isopentenylpyrophosphate transferase [Lactococcus cremoris subsp. cremoris TIFN3]MDU1525007.1 tRNA (adenosine(37)-N6)-dimethylallyltransferase MiaA [Lactococcus lactis]MCT4399347.1 tRNA (adenosine(37)-N6)-dimethylallyltransferase MiaA [Lactococcus cremoris]MCT4427997.1 tRNA (adenosine(37)-N6)-dimethylallyltransferase MiaA [Lactococcus cremoris]MDU2184434.1 tRNA (adenosine(37)-N6)-dimethylall